MIMETEIRDFALYLEAEIGYSTQTATSYRYDLRQFCQFLEAHDVPLDAQHVSTTIVRQWVIQMHRRGLASNTVARHLCALRSFWDYLLRHSAVSEDPVRQVSVPRRTYSLPKYLGAEDLEKSLMLHSAIEPHDVLSATMR